MKQGRAIGHGAIERRQVGEVSDRELDGQGTEIASIRALAHQRAHLPPVGEQRPGDRRADESGGARDQRPHRRFSESIAAGASRPSFADRTKRTHGGSIAARQIHERHDVPGRSGNAQEEPADPNLSGFAGGRDRGRNRIERGVDDDANRHERHVARRGDLRDGGALHVDGHRAGFAACRRLGGRARDRVHAGEQSARCQRPA